MKPLAFFLLIASSIGLVQATQSCGGIQGKPCPANYICVDDPRDTCDPKQGGRDCIGVCVKKKSPQTISCGGLKGQPCPARAPKCIDDPYDSCDPSQGGADCSGVCVEKGGPTICGTRGGATCQQGFECLTRTPKCEQFDCGGICVAVK